MSIILFTNMFPEIQKISMINYKIIKVKYRIFYCKLIYITNICSITKKLKMINKKLVKFKHYLFLLKI